MDWCVDERVWRMCGYMGVKVSVECMYVCESVDLWK